MSTTTSAAAAPPQPRTRPRWPLAWRALYAAAVLGLVAFNAWWFARDRLPTPGLREARALIDRRQTDEGIRAVRAILRRSPHHDEAIMLLARAEAARGDLAAGARTLGTVPFWSPRAGEARALEGQILLDLGRAVPAESALRAAVEDDPQHPTPPRFHQAATEQLIELYAAEERWGEARDVVWKTFLKVGPPDKPAALAMWLRTVVERLEPKSRLAKLERYAAADPADVHARRALARVLQELGRESDADGHIRACLELRPQDADVWRDYLLILRARGDQKGLAAAVAKLPKSAANDAVIWDLRAQVREAARDHEGAIAAYREAVRLDPFADESRYRLSLALARTGRRDEAREQSASAKAIRDARTALVDAVIDYQASLAANLDLTPAQAKAAAQVAALCRTIGLAKVADALLAVHPPPAA
jgi:tetratricopeptide (TPR) repeat protein